MKKFTNKILSFVLVAMILCSIIPFSASAAIDILVVDVYDVSAPVEGESPDYGIYLPESYHDVAGWFGDGYYNGIRWTDEFGNILDPEDDVFVYGVSYTVEINLIANDNNSYIRARDVAIDDEEVEYSISPDNRIITLYKTFETVIDDDDVCAIICDFGFDNNYDFILNEVGTIPRTPEYIDREGYTILGWYTEPQFINEYDFMDPESSNLRLYARYVPLEDLVTIYMYTDDPEFPYSIADGVIGDYVNVPDPSYVDTFKFFTGWYADKELTEKYDFSQPIEGDVHLYARLISYDDVAIITTYKPEESFYTNYYEVEKGEYFYLPDMDVEDMFFDGWFYDKEFTSPYDPELPVTEDFAVYAKLIPYSEMHTVTIWFSPDDEYPIASGYVKDGEIYDIEDPGQEGKLFMGWYTDPEFKNQYNYTPVTSDLDLYAKFVSEEDLCAVTLYVFSTTEPLITIGIEKGTQYEPAEPGMEDMIFDGWYTEAEYINKVEMPFTVTADIDLYAKFVPVTDYLKGDANNDGVVDILDATTIQRFIAGYPITIYVFDAADIDGNGEIDIMDATRLQRFLAGYSDNL